MIKLTVLYGHPKDPAAFESYYNTTHMQVAEKMRGVARFELTRFTGSPEGGTPAFYRMAELYFADMKQMEATLQSPEGMAALNDLANFATGGATAIVGRVEE